MAGIRKSYRVGCNAILGLAALGVIVFGCYAQYTHEETVTATVYSITTQQNVMGGSDGFYTTYTYLVGTDKGTLAIQPSSIMASTVFGRLKEGCSYRLRTRGFSLPLIGMYPYIIDAKEETITTNKKSYEVH